MQDWTWIIFALIAIGAGIIDQMNKSKKSTPARPWGTAPVDPPVMYPTDPWPTIGPNLEQGVEHQDLGDDGQTESEGEFWEEGMTVPEMVAPVMVSEEGESTWSDLPMDDEAAVGSAEETVTRKPMKYMDDEEMALADWRSSGLDITPERVVEAVIFSEILARPRSKVRIRR